VRAARSGKAPECAPITGHPNSSWQAPAPAVNLPRPDHRAPQDAAANSSSKGASWIAGYGAYLRLDIPLIMPPAAGEGVEQRTVLYTDADVMLIKVHGGGQRQWAPPRSFAAAAGGAWNNLALLRLGRVLRPGQPELYRLTSLRTLIHDAPPSS
jgi:hypothetical protein